MNTSIIQLLDTNFKITETKHAIIQIQKTNKPTSKIKFPLASLFERQMKQYLQSKRSQFDIPFQINTSPFHFKVLKEIQKIPFGQTRTYQEIAQKINQKNAHRAVAQACAKNPILFLIPCHRVVGKTNPYAYQCGEIWKKNLLDLESKKTP